ncbi:hypothetical protein [Leuconostoc lactis]|uniref:hypothetical protein n=1 Tax=Leuconostoc lactis TaxID=1246 RepID=UPI0021A27CE8|nr:hypothetical protein [Leuconostoc lactis]MCT3116117.1 hypothetical protein [Leuconostoc lactis]
MKKLATTLVIAFALLGAGTTAKAAYDWSVGHADLQRTNSNIDTLVSRIDSLKEQKHNAQQSIRDLNKRISDLQSQKETDEASLQQQIKESNDTVATKQDELNNVNKKIDDLSVQLSDLKQSNDQLGKALQDAHDTAMKSDQAVKITK